MARIDREKVRQDAEKFVEKKKYDKAVLEYQKLIQVDPNDARTLLKIGDLQSKMLAWPDAIDTYERVGKLYSHQGFALKAIAVYKQIREIIAKHVPQLEERYAHIAPKLAELYQQLGLTSDALAALDEVATRLQRQQRDGEAIEVFRKIVELDPSNPLPHLRLAEALSRVKDVEGAVQEFGVAAQQLVELGRRDDALKVLERLLHHRPAPEQARLAAELYLSRGLQADGMQALAKLQICFQANPRDLDTLGLLARAFESIGQPAKSIEVQKEMARIARDTGQKDVFRQLLDKLTRVAPHDEGVRKLAMGSAAPPPVQPSAPPAPPPQPPPTAAAAAPRPPPLPPSSPQVGRPPPPPVPASARQAPPPPPPPIQEEDSAVEQIEEVSYQSVQEHELSYQSAQAEDDYRDAPPEVVVDADMQAAEELAEPPNDASEQLAQILADAQSFRRVRLYAKALETLRIGLEIEPRSFEVREAYRDVLLESGDTAAAVDEMLMLASLYIDSLDGESAARMLQDALAYDPQNARAISMLQELGYEIVEEGQDAGGADTYEAPQEQEPADQDRLPAYELDESSAQAPAYGEPARQPLPEQAPQAAVARMDDPFGDGPLPSFPLEAESAESFDLVQPQQRQGAAPSGQLVQDTYEEDAPEAEQPSSRTAALELEAALEEAEFFASRGLYDDAKAIVHEQLALHPNHPLLLERMEEISLQEVAARGSGTRAMPRDRGFDLASSLDAIESLGGGPPAGGFDQPSQQVDVEEVFSKFKEGVAAQISLDDSQSHYDLGVAYKEMGLLEDSIREFDLAARDPKRECMCRAMMGQIQMERGNVNEAIDAFMRGLHAQIRSPEQEMMLCFEIGSAYEVKKMTKEALSYYQRVLRRDPSYRDVQERVRRLSKNEPPAPVRQVAVGADDEFDRAFDDIIGKG